MYSFEGIILGTNVWISAPTPGSRWILTIVFLWLSQDKVISTQFSLCAQWTYQSPHKFPLFLCCFWLKIAHTLFQVQFLWKETQSYHLYDLLPSLPSPQTKSLNTISGIGYEDNSVLFSEWHNCFRNWVFHGWRKEGGFG